MNKTFTRASAVAAAAAALTFTMGTPALASADKCQGDAHASCVGVNGTGLHVNWIKSRVSPWGKTCLYGHSQVLINSAHYADSNGGKDATYCGTSYLGSEITTGVWNVNRNYARGTTICSKFWRYTGDSTGAVNGYKSLGTACATVS